MGWEGEGGGGGGGGGGDGGFLLTPTVLHPHSGDAETQVSLTSASKIPLATIVLM
jgi:hypothetical protein